MIEASISLENVFTNQTESLFIIYNPSSEVEVVEVSKKATSPIMKLMIFLVFVFLVWTLWGCDRRKKDKFKRRINLSQSKYEESLERERVLMDVSEKNRIINKRCWNSSENMRNYFLYISY